jgi:WD40 repeat protein
MRSVQRRFAVLVLVIWSSLSLEAAADESSKPTLILQMPPATSVDSVAVSPDGMLVATASGEGGVRLYDAKTGRLQQTLGDVGDRCVAFTPDGKRLTAAGFHMDKLAKVVDVQSATRALLLPGHTEWEVDATAISPDGKWLASSGVDQQILVWDVATGQLRHRFENQPFRTPALAFSPDSATLAAGGGDRHVKLWDMATGELRASFGPSQDWIAAMSYAADGKTIATASCNWGFHRAHDWVQPAGMPAEQSELAVWAVDSGKKLQTITGPGRMLTVAFSPDGSSLACGLDEKVLLHDASLKRSSRVLTTHDAIVTAVAFTPDGKSLLTSSHDQTVRRTEIASGRLEWRADGYYEQINSIALSDEASLLVAGSSDQRFARGKALASAPFLGPGAVRIWDVKTGRLLRRLGDPAEQVMAAAISRDGSRCAAGGVTPGGKGFVRVWAIMSGEQRWSAIEHAAPVLALAFTPDARLLAAGNGNGTVTIYESASGLPVRTLAGHAGGATSLEFSPNGRTLVCGEAFGGVRIWEVATGNLVFACPAANAEAERFPGDPLMNSIALSGDGRTLAICASSINNEFVSPLELWSVADRQRVRRFDQEKIHGRPMALSADGSIVATGGKTVKLWDTRSGKILRELFGHLKRTQSIVFSSDGRRVFAGGSYGTTNIWDVDTGRHLITLFAFARHKKNETEDEWLAYAPSGFYTGSPECENYLAWLEGNKLVMPENLAAKRRQPEQLELILGAK